MDDRADPMAFQRKGLRRGTVHRLIRLRHRSLRDVKILLKTSSNFPSPPVVGNDVQNSKLERTSHSAMSRDGMDTSLQGNQADLSKAEQWVKDMLTYHTTIFLKEHFARLWRSAIIKDLMGGKDRWGEVEMFYMILTSPSMPDPEHRLRSAVLWVHNHDLAERLDDVRNLVKQRYEAQQRASKLDKALDDLRVKVVEQMHDAQVDHFACAVPLANQTPRSNILDANEGSCPVCQNSYTDLSTNTAAELLADFPVRIKYCGHVIGKACLEQWMSTPKIDEAKYPYRTCPMCRVNIEGAAAPSPPEKLRAHIKMDRRATETLKELVYGWDMDLEECLDTVTKNMSEEIACEEIVSLLESLPEKARQGHKSATKMLQERMDKLKAERWVWGLKSDRVWMQLRDEWMESGVVRKD